MAIKKPINKLIIALAAIGLIVLIILLSVYIFRIRFYGDLRVSHANENLKIVSISPLGSVTVHSSEKGMLQGYFSQIFIENAGDQAPGVRIQSGDNASVSLEMCYQGNGKYEIIPYKISIFEKVYAFLYYGRQWLVFLITILLISGAIIWQRRLLRKKYEIIQSNTKKKIAQLRCLIRSHAIKILIALLIASGIYPLLYCAGIDFSVLYNLTHASAYILTLPFFMIPAVGMALWSKLRQPLVFAAFWIILFSMYFVISPHVFAGNFGFHGFFHSFIIEAMNNGFLQNLILPDTGYLAVLPRILFGFSALMNPSISQVMAITSFASLVIYALIFSRLVSADLKFLWKDHTHAFLFTVIIALFPVFNLVPGLIFPLPATDVAYFGMVLVLICLFTSETENIRNHIGLVFFSLIVVLSKAHMVVLLPAVMIALLFAIFRKNRRLLLTSSVLTLGILIQGIYCYLSLSQADATLFTTGSFSIGQAPLIPQIFAGMVYYLKSYLYIFAPFVDNQSSGSIALLLIAAIVVFGLFYVSIRNIFLKRQFHLSAWFILCNVSAITSAIFYTVTSGEAIFTSGNNAMQSITGLPINLMRYTIGVHTLLVISVVPFAMYLLESATSRFTTKTRALSGIALILLLTSGIIFHHTAFVYPEFWSTSKHDNWSREWSKIAPILKNKEFYIPIVFYPEYKQNMHTHKLGVYSDILPDNESSFGFRDTVSLHSVIVLADESKIPEKHPTTMSFFRNGEEIGRVKPYYKFEQRFRFIIFVTDKPALTDSIVFYNSENNPAILNTHLRVICHK